MEPKTEEAGKEGASLAQLKAALVRSYLECAERGLLYSAEWAIELANSIETPEVLQLHLQIDHTPQFQLELTQYYHGLSLHRMGEFRRAAHILCDCTSSEAFFLHCYSLYLAGEKAKEDNRIDVIGPEEEENIVNTELLGLKRKLANRISSKQLDSYGYYLYGVVLKELGSSELARGMLVTSLSLQPMFWGAWQELAKLCKDREMLYSQGVPYHWLKDFYLAAGSLHLLLVEEALSYYTNLALVGFSSSTHITTQLAIVNYHRKDFDGANNLFVGVRKKDPYILVNMDIFSNVLFVMDQVADLTQLAQDVVKIDKYRSETCSVLGNFYSLRGDHDKAIAYFRRALRLNDHDHSAWVLLGHEYLEKKNCCMALEAYSRGLEVNKHDFRGHYGMGHVYEIVGMHHYALYYYKQAHRLRSSDSRILLAMGLCYEELNQWEEAKKCMKRAIAFKDKEGMATIKLAKLHEKLKEDEEAAHLYTLFIAQSETTGVHIPEEQGHAHLFLARYHLNKNNYSDAEAHAHKSGEFLDTREEGKSLMQEIQKHRAVSEVAGASSLAASLATLESDHEISPIT